MAVFNIFEHPDKGLDRTELVREGFASWAVVFSVLWALWHRMWIVAAALLLMMAIISLASVYDVLPANVASLLEAGLALLFGFEANALRGFSLRRAGYQEVAVVSADSLEIAELKYTASAIIPPVPVVRSSVPPPIQPPTDTLGLFGNV